MSGNNLTQTDLQNRFAHEMRLAKERQEKRIQMGPGDTLEMIVENTTGQTHITQNFVGSLDQTMDALLLSLQKAVPYEVSIQGVSLVMLKITRDPVAEQRRRAREAIDQGFNLFEMLKRDVR